MNYKTLLIFLLFSISVSSQNITRITLTNQGRTSYIPAYNFEGVMYIDVQSFAAALAENVTTGDNGKKISVEFKNFNINIAAKNPFVILVSKQKGEAKTFQLPTSTHLMSERIFAPLQQMAEIFSYAFENPIVSESPYRLIVIYQEEAEQNIVTDLSIYENAKGTYIKIKAKNNITGWLEDLRDRIVKLHLRRTSIIVKQFSDLKTTGLIEQIDYKNIKDDSEINIKLVSSNITAEIIPSSAQDEMLLYVFEREDNFWLYRESRHFKIIYRQSHAHLANKILMDAENALQPLMKLFDYKPTEKIIINTYDVNDYGFGATTTVPQNFIRLELEPLEPGYETTPYHDRIQWLLSHELVHIVINDHSTGVESFFRSIFGKVPPEKTQPFTVIYSLLTNYKRYTPRWYQESIAVLIETWFSGGYGRLFGSFDEMYFRTFISENKKFPNHMELETIESHNSMFLVNIFYFYGARFLTYLSIKYGTEKVLDWFRAKEGSPYIGFESKFEEVFGKDFNTAWDEFAQYEKKFQQENIDLLQTSHLTAVRKVSNEKFGWITQPHYDRQTNSLFFGFHRPHQLATLQKLNLQSGKSVEIGSLPTPSMLQVASTAFDEKLGLLFYTTNNNMLYRDVWVMDIETGDNKILFENARIGDLTISPADHTLWGVQHLGGISTLVASRYPYQKVEQLKTLNMGDELSFLSIDKSGSRLAAVLKFPNGQQSVIVINAKDLLEGKPFDYLPLSSSGTPENPSWSTDGRYLYWNAFTNGVSNIYRYDFSDFSLTAISNCITGLFKPVEISPDSLIAFMFSTDGFYPVYIANKPADHLPAINYMAQRILQKDNYLFEWSLPEAAEVIDPLEFSKEEGYNGLENLNVQSLVPVVSGFQNQVVFGLFSHISDPLLLHDFILEVGISPLKEIPSYPQWHFRFKYDYKQKFYIDVTHNGQDFFDLFNDRKRGMLGTKFKLGYTYYWKYDKPHKIKQASTLTFYRGIEFINDNLVRVSQPDFGVLATTTNSKSLRKSIGSSDFEFGNDIFLTFTLYGTNFAAPEFAANTYAEFGNFSTWLWKHNVLHVKIAGGYLLDNPDLVQARFYIGGFGNRGVDNAEIRQFRRIFRFPGIPIYSLSTDRFVKLMIENDFPPIRTSSLYLGHQFINHLDFALYSQGMITNSEFGNYWIDIGAQMDVKLKHWYNLESTVSAGIAKAWSDKMNDWQWFVSIKLLKD